MATTTPNFGWAVPTSSDLVKNGATAIETLGDAIDASLVDLKGGTTGQVLTKATNTDMDFTWATPSGGGATLVGCALKRTTDPSIADSTWTTITYDSEVYDTDAFHSTSTNTSRITIPTGKGGKYQVFANIIFAPNATGNRAVGLLVNGSETFRAYGARPDAASSSNYLLYTTDTFNAGDYLEIRIFQGSGGSLTSYFNGFGNYFGVNYLGA